MQLTEITYSDARPIESYGPGFFRIAGQLIEGAALIRASGAQGWGGYDDTAAILALQDEIDVVFVGTGGDVAHLPAAFRDAIEAAGIGVESMSSPAACRTYNVLLSEGRRVAAALMPV